MAVAFLKMSGLNTINESLVSFINRGGELYFIAGQNFALTEPDALKMIFNLRVIQNQIYTSIKQKQIVVSFILKCTYLSRAIIVRLSSAQQI